MSYILEALKKAEQQRHMGRVPGIASVHDAQSMRPRRHWLWLLILVVNAGVLVALLWSNRNVEPMVESATRESRSEAGSTPPPTPPRNLPAPQSPAAPEVTAVAPPAVQTAPVPPPPVRLAQPEVDQRSPVSARGADAMQAIAAELVPPKTVSLPAAVTASSSLPVWPQIPGHLFQQINAALHLDVHVYGEQPHSRFVLINLRKYREGDDLQEGPVLEEITREGVILSFRGERFQVHRQ